MFYTIYQITNLINGKIYIGKHQTKNLDDGYMGSGKKLGNAKRKYGIENFKKEILFIFNNEQEMNDKEKELVTEEFCLKEDTYNLCPGGKGGWGYANLDKRTWSAERLNERNKLLSEKLKGNSNCFEGGKKTGSKNYSNAHKAGKIRYDTLTGTKRSEETKRKIGSSNSISQKGERNSQYGTFWITDGIQNRKIRNDEIIPENWYKGRNYKRRN